MRVFIPKGTEIFKSNEILNVNVFNAYYGFSTLGWEVVFYENTPPDGLSREDIVVGWIGQVKKALTNLGITPPGEIDYPEEIREYLGRNIWKSTLHKIYTDDSTWPVFVKPVSGKQFDGKLVKSLKDLVGIGSQEDREIWCSDPIEFISEYRCFIRYGKILDARRYKGSFKEIINFDVVERCIEDYKSQPAGYSLDFGVTKDGRTILIEVNDGYSMGCYGLHSLDYAKLMSARWHQMVDLPDPCHF